MKCDAEASEQQDKYSTDVVTRPAGVDDSASLTIWCVAFEPPCITIAITEARRGFNRHAVSTGTRGKSHKEHRFEDHRQGRGRSQ